MCHLIFDISCVSPDFEFYPWRYNGETLPSANPLTKRYGAPVYDPAYGWGEMQLTWLGGTTRASAQQVWDWHANVLGGIARLDTCRLCAGQNPETHNYCDQCAIGWMNRQRIQANGEPVPEGIYGSFIFGDEWFDPVDACTIQAQKGDRLFYSLPSGFPPNQVTHKSGASNQVTHNLEFRGQDTKYAQSPAILLDIKSRATASAMLRCRSGMKEKGSGMALE